MKHEISLDCSQNPTTGPNPNSDESSPSKVKGKVVPVL
jgi:hypothetical protein